MEGAVSATAASWAAVTAGILALVALFLMWKARTELREVLAARRPTGTSGWRTPISPPDASRGRPHADGKPVADSGTGVATIDTPASNPDVEVEPRHVEVLTGGVEEPEPLELLLELLDDDDPETRRDAVVALAGIGGRGGTERLTLILSRDPSAEVRREAVVALRDSLERPGSGPAR